MEYLTIILEEDKPVCFLSNEFEKSFVYEGHIFMRSTGFVGEFYSYHIFLKEGRNQLGGFRYEFECEDSDFQSKLEKIQYAELQSYPTPGSYSLKMQLGAQAGEEMKNYLELFGDDTAYVSEENNLIAFKLYFPQGIDI